MASSTGKSQAGHGPIGVPTSSEVNGSCSSSGWEKYQPEKAASAARCDPSGTWVSSLRLTTCASSDSTEPTFRYCWVPVTNSPYRPGSTVSAVRDSEMVWAAASNPRRIVSG